MAAGGGGAWNLRTCILRISPQDLRTQTGPVQRKKEKNKVETETKVCGSGFGFKSGDL